MTMRVLPIFRHAKSVAAKHRDPTVLSARQKWMQGFRRQCGELQYSPCNLTFIDDADRLVKETEMISHWPTSDDLERNRSGEALSMM